MFIASLLSLRKIIIEKIEFYNYYHNHYHGIVKWQTAHHRRKN